MTGIPGQPMNQTVHTVPSVEERLVCSLQLGKGLLVEFQAWATSNIGSSPNSARIDSYLSGSFVGMFLFFAPEKEGHMVNVCPVTVASPALLSPSWVATVIESEAQRHGFQHDPLDLAVLEVAAKKAYKAALSHCMTAFSMLLVEHGLSAAEAASAFDDAIVRSVMSA